MTLDEAITHACEIAERGGECAEDHRQLAEWLEELRGIVRCRDCKDYRASDATCHSWQWHNWDAAIEVEPDGFCAWAERKESGE